MNRILCKFHQFHSKSLPPIFDFEDRERERVEIFIQFHISIKPKFLIFEH